MASREIKNDWWRVDPPDFENPFWIHGHVSFRHEGAFVGLLLGFIGGDGSHGVLFTADETRHRFAVMILSNNEESDSTTQNELLEGYVTFRSRWPGSRGNPVPDGVEILDRGLFWWAPGLNFLIDR